MTYQILNGDSLAHDFASARIPGEVIVFREGLSTGDLSGETPEEFWMARAKYMKTGFNQYQSMVLDELEKITASTDGDEFNLWFEYDLFCQVNMWFLCSMLYLLPKKKKVFAVYTLHLEPNDKNFWGGFGRATVENLRECFTGRIILSEKDLAFAHSLWQAFRSADTKTLSKLSTSGNPSFPFIQPVIEAHLDKERPARVVENILANGTANFEYVFNEFWKRESIYGFADLQLKPIYDSVMEKRKKK